MRRPAAWLLAFAATAAPAGKPAELDLPYGRVAPTTRHAVFYRVEGGHQFLFVVRLPERRLVAVEIDRREGTDEDGEEEVIHRLPVARLDGGIQYLPLEHLPLPRRRLLGWMGRRTLALPEGSLVAKAGDGFHWLASAFP